MMEYEIIRRPVISEKSNIQKKKCNQISFEVDRKANRIEIKKAIEKIFKVKVANVQTIQVMGKFKRRGKIIGKRKDWKKAIVRLEAGERIEFFD